MEDVSLNFVLAIKYLFRKLNVEDFMRDYSGSGGRCKIGCGDGFAQEIGRC